MIGTTQKAQSPAATGLSADENTSTDIVSLKRETTLIARCAMKGAAVHRLADGGFIVAQWGLTVTVLTSLRLSGSPVRWG